MSATIIARVPYYYGTKHDKIPDDFPKWLKKKCLKAEKDFPGPHLYYSYITIECPTKHVEQIKSLLELGLKQNHNSEDERLKHGGISIRHIHYKQDKQYSKEEITNFITKKEI